MSKKYRVSRHWFNDPKDMVYPITNWIEGPDALQRARSIKSAEEPSYHWGQPPDHEIVIEEK